MKNPLNLEFKMLVQFDPPDPLTLPGVRRLRNIFRRAVLGPGTPEAKAEEKKGEDLHGCETGFTLKTTLSCDRTEGEK